MRNKSLKKSIQIISYLPHFVSWVVVAGIFRQMMNSSGFMNDVLMALGIIHTRVDFLSKPELFYGVVTIATIWKELGWNAIMYISSMAGIDQELYEAASVDGAGRLRKMWNITLPSIKPTIMILLIINIGGVLGGGFEKQFLFENALNTDKSMVLDLYVLQYGIRGLRFSFGTAVSIITSLTSLVLVYSANKLSKKFAGTSLV
jgi:putative aldouronate transport system permease protein